MPKNKVTPGQLKKEFLGTLASLAKEGDPIFDEDQNHTFSVEGGVICFRDIAGHLICEYELKLVG